MTVTQEEKIEMDRLKARVEELESSINNLLAAFNSRMDGWMLLTFVEKELKELVKK